MTPASLRAARAAEPREGGASTPVADSALWSAETPLPREEEAFEISPDLAHEMEADDCGADSAGV